MRNRKLAQVGERLAGPQAVRIWPVMEGELCYGGGACDFPAMLRDSVASCALDSMERVERLADARGLVGGHGESLRLLQPKTLPWM
jgi:hypothetical protein